MKEKKKKLNLENLKFVTLEELPEEVKRKIPEQEFKCLICGEVHKGLFCPNH